MAEQADARDLKSLGGNTVPVRFRSPAPKSKANLKGLPYFFYYQKAERAESNGSDSHAMTWKTTIEFVVFSD